jgi:hypothetical protein
MPTLLIFLYRIGEENNSKKENGISKKEGSEESDHHRQTLINPGKRARMSVVVNEVSEVISFRNSNI